MTGLPHVWTMEELEAHHELWNVENDFGATVPPHCKHCGIDSFTAQQEHPETKGVGPCPKRTT